MEQYQILCKTMKQLSVFMEKQNSIFNKNIVNFLMPQKYEFESIIELQNVMEKCHKDFTEGDKRLAAKKEALFKSKNLEKWKLDPQALNTISKETLLKNKSLAFVKMLPKENEDMRGLYIHFTYFANQMRDEIKRIHRQKEISFKKHVEKLFKVENELVESVKFLNNHSGEIYGRSYIIRWKK